MAKRKADPPKVVDRSGPDPECLHCHGKGAWPEWKAKGYDVRVFTGKCKNALPCCKCWSHGG